MEAGLTASFFQPSAYDNITEAEDFPADLELVWILGSKYSVHSEREELEKDVRSRFLFTYRKGFDAIGGTGPTTDIAWGCMLRCGQMMLAQALVNRHLSRDWRRDPKNPDPVYVEILKMFLDKRDGCYSIHQIASMGVSEGKAVGEWFGPNTVAQVLRKLAVYDHWSGLVIHVAMDNCIIIDDIRELCLCPGLPANLAGAVSNNVPSSVATNCVPMMNDTHSNFCASRSNDHWRPLLLVVPMRLGLSEINPIYFSAVKTCFTLKQSVGIIGGKPNNAYWFIGCSEHQLFYLDPHRAQPFVDLSNGQDDLDSFHCNYPHHVDISQLDPSVAVGFYCGTEEDFDDLCDALRRISVPGLRSSPLFEVHMKRPAHFPPVHPYNPSDTAAASVMADFTLLDEQRVMDSEDEFEIIL